MIEFSRTALILVLMPVFVIGNYCGESSMPISLEVLPNGLPVLKCARPACFGWTLTSASHATNFHAETVKCESAFRSEHCPDDNQWIGGIGSLANYSQPLVASCCQSDALRLSEKRGVAVVTPGQIVVGGEVFHGGRPFAFDFVSDVIKHNSANGTVSYNVYIRRYPCLPYPNELQMTVDGSVLEEIKHITPKTNKAFAAGLLPQQDIENPLPEIEGLEGDTEPAEPPAAPPADPSEELPAEPLAAQLPVELPVNPPAAPPPAPPAAPGQVPVINYEWQWVPDNTYYYPVSGNRLYYCFAKDSVVTLPSGGTKRMDELEIDDWVLSAGDSKIGYSRVRTWLHRMASAKAEFIRIRTEDGNTIKLTAQHYIYRGNCQNIGKQVPADLATSNNVFAEEITVNNCLFVYDASTEALVERRITKIDRVVEEGIYAPLTEIGNVVVDNVLASCYNVVENEFLLESYPALLEWYIHSFWNRLWGNSAADISLVPGLDTLFQMIKLIVPQK